MAVDAYQEWLGIPADRRPPTYYDLLGLNAFESDPETIERAALRRMAKVREQQIGPNSELSQEILAELARARLILSDPDRRAEYDEKLGANRNEVAVDSTSTAVSAPDREPSTVAGRGDDVPDVLGSLYLAESSGTVSLRVRAAPASSRAIFKKASAAAVFVALHCAVFWAFVVFVVPLIAKLSGALPPNPPEPSLNQPNTVPIVRPGPLPKPKVPINYFTFDGKTRVIVANGADLEMTTRDYTITAWVRTMRDGAILSKSAREGPWSPDAKALFVRDGKLAFDIGWVGCVESTNRIDDGVWHRIAMTFNSENRLVRLFVDARPEGQESLAPGSDGPEHTVQIGYTAPGTHCESNYFLGQLHDVRFYQRLLTLAEIEKLAAKEPARNRLLAKWALTRTTRRSVHDESGNGHDGTLDDAPEPALKNPPADENPQEPMHEPESPEEVLKRHGLRRTGDLYVFASEIDLRKKAADIQRLDRELSLARTQQTATGSPEGRQRTIAMLNEEIETCQRDIRSMNQEMQQMPRTRGVLSYSWDAERYPVLVSSRIAVETYLTQIKTYLDDLQSQPFDFQSKQMADSLVNDKQAALKRALDEFGDRLDAMKQEYAQLANAVDIKIALRDVGKIKKFDARLGPSSDFPKYRKLLDRFQKKRSKSRKL